MYPANHAPITPRVGRRTRRNSIDQPVRVPAQTITQQELWRIQELSAGARELKALRESVKSRLADGAVVEPGPLDAQLNLTESRRFTAANLEILIGPQHVAWLKSQLPATIQCSVVIYSNPDGA